MSDLRWKRNSFGHYIVELPEGDPSGVTRYYVTQIGSRRWAVFSFVGVVRTCHGDCRTLREAKDIVARFYDQRLDWAAQDSNPVGV